MFAIDRRALAAFRIAIALILLVDLLIRSGSVLEHYSDRGILPRSQWVEQNKGTARWSLHAMNGEPAFQRALMIAGALAAGAMLVGWKTRGAVTLAWLLTHSIQMRNPMINNGGDILLRGMLLWAVFLPLGVRWSIDALLAGARSPTPGAPSRKPEAPSRKGGAMGEQHPAAPVATADSRTPTAPPSRDGAPDHRDGGRLLTIASACILLQLALMYVFSGLYKLNDTWAGGGAMRRSLSFDLYVKPVGEWMLGNESMLATVSRAVPWIEIIVPLLCFIPFLTSWFRGLAIIVFLGLHIMIGLTMTTGLFPWVCMASWLLFVPTSWWNAMGRSHLAPRDEAHFSQDRLPRRHLLQLPLAVLFLFLLLWNTSNYQEHIKKDRILGENWAWLAECTGLDQLWEMFREPPVDTGWYVITGTLSNGKEINLLTGVPLTTADVGSVERPSRIYAQFPDHRWRKYLASLSADSHKGYRTVFAKAWAHRWNARHGEDEQVDFIEVNFVREKTVAPGDAAVPLQRVLFLKIPVIKEGEANIGPDRRWRTGWE